MGWSVDWACWFEIREKILKGRYAGCCYSVSTSNSPIIIAHRGEITRKEMKKIMKLFPDNIRVEFQHVEYEGERVNLYGGEGSYLWDRPLRVVIKGLPGSVYAQGNMSPFRDGVEEE